MFIIQLTGLSGAGKTTLAFALKDFLRKRGVAVEVLDGDACRNTLCRDLGFSPSDRRENIRRLAALADQFCKQGILSIIAAINPFEDVRREVKETFGAKTVWVCCDNNELLRRDTKGLYKRALLPDGDPQKIRDLTGINAVYEIPECSDLIIDTTNAKTEESLSLLINYVNGWIAEAKD